MSRADELLETLSDEGLQPLTVEPHIVIDINRKITVPDALKRIAVQYDHNIETVTFDCPRYWDGHDMSQMAVYINYRCPDGTLGCYPADNVVVDESNDTIMHFDWTISKNVTMKDGQLMFLVCIKTVNEDGEELIHWNSELNTEMYISKGLEGSEITEELYPDVITQLLLRMESVEQMVGPSSGGEAEVFTAVYGVTTTAELEAAYAKGQVIVCTVNNTVYIMTYRISAAKHRFSGPFKSNAIYIIDVTENVWGAETKHTISSLLNLGDNITKGVENDTALFWREQPSGRSWVSQPNMLVDQPHQYGFILNYVHNSDVFQIFRRQPEGPTYWRGGNASGWSHSWRRVYDDGVDQMVVNGTAYFTEAYVGTQDNYKKLATQEDIANAIAELEARLKA